LKWILLQLIAAVDSLLTGHAPFSPGDERCASVYSRRERWSKKPEKVGSVSNSLSAGEVNSASPFNGLARHDDT
jgi:hypothetical protein